MTPAEALEHSINDESGVYVADDQDRASYISGLIDAIRRNACEPFLLDAVATEPGFADAFESGETISGWCVAHAQGYWLVFDPARATFYCFWGTDRNRLSAPGIEGAPLHCWSA